MPILPALQPLFRAIVGRETGRSGHDLSLDEARAIAHASMERFITAHYAPAEPLPREADYGVPVPSGAITIRIYAPQAGDSAVPCHVYYHRGGFWLGKVEHFDALCRALARDAHCAVASVDYRLAPEHKFPAAAEDAYAALSWVVERAAELGIDPGQVSVGGVSAGGNLAAVAAIMARDRGGPRLVAQVLEVPVTDLSSRDPLRIPEEDLELPSGKEIYCRHYLADPADALLAHASPLLAKDLSGLPPALVMCAEYDELAAEGKAYAMRLAEAGVPVEHVCWPGQFHGAQPMAALIPEEATAYQAKIVAFLRKAYA